MTDRAGSAVLVVGAGGLGGPIAMALAASGVGTIRVCDPDAVELSNLQRQIQFSIADVGGGKAAALARRLERRGAARVESRAAAFSPETAASLAHGIDVIIDGSDNFATKFAVNDAAVAAGAGAVIAAAIGARGQVMAVPPGAACYRCLFEAPPEIETGTCANAGILGAACAVIAGEAARAALALIDGVAIGSLVVYDDVAAAPRRIDLEPRAGCPACAASPANRAARARREVAS